MLVQTEDGLYDVDLAHCAYRLIHHDGGDRVLGAWVAYDRISPVREGEPLRFFVSIEEAGRSLLYRVITTGRVTSVLAA